MKSVNGFARFLKSHAIMLQCDRSSAILNVEYIIEGCVLWLARYLYVNSLAVVQDIMIRLLQVASLMVVNQGKSRPRFKCMVKAGFMVGEKVDLMMMV